MKRTTIIIAIALVGVMSAEGAVAAPQRNAHVSRCIAEQRAMLAPLDQYGGYVPSNAPALVQRMINPILDTVRTRCLPRYYGPPQFNPVTGNYE